MSSQVIPTSSPERPTILTTAERAVYEEHFKVTTFVKIGFWTLRKILTPIIRLLWIKHFEGIEHLPKIGPAIVVSNHCSYLDFFLFLGNLPSSSLLSSGGKILG